MGELNVVREKCLRLVTILASAAVYLCDVAFCTTAAVVVDVVRLRLGARLLAEVEEERSDRWNG